MKSWKLKTLKGAAILGAPFVLSASAVQLMPALSFEKFEASTTLAVEVTQKKPELYLELSQEELSEVADQVLALKNRSTLREWTQNLYTGWNCAENSQIEKCLWIESFWKETVNKMFFHDSSPVYLSEIRDTLKNAKNERDCDSSRATLSKIQTQEGDMPILLETEEKLLDCLGDEQGKIEVYQSIERLIKIENAN